MRLVLIDSLGHAENSDTSVAIVSQISCLPFWFMLKTYFFKLLLNRLSDFHQIWLWGCISAMLWHIYIYI